MIAFIPFGTRENMPRRRFPIVTVLLVLLNLFVFGYELNVLLAGGESALQQLMLNYGAVPQSFTGTNIVQFSLITSMFLHGGLLHIASNMIFLLAFGDNVEDRLGHWKFLMMYFIWGIIAAYAQILFSLGSGIPMVGASGAIAGVLASYLVLFPTGMVRTFLFVFIFFTITRVPAMVLIIFWFGMQLMSGIASLGVTTAQTGGVAFWAHIGGFMAGLVTTLFLKRKY